MKALRISAVALLVLAAAAVAGVGLPERAGGAADSQGKGITVNGVGTVKTVPDRAQLSLGAQANGATAAEALRRNSAEMRRIIAAVKGAGVDAKDIRTQDVSVSPRYSPDGKPVDGYTARSSISVQTKLPKAGDVLDAATAAGATEVYGPSLTRADREELQAKALQDAVRNARVKARALAEAADVRLGDVTAISEAFDGGPEPVYAARMAVAESKAPIEPGTEDIQATVTVTFAIS